MKIDIGDRVTYSMQFLRSVGMSHDEPMSKGVGTVKRVTQLSQDCLLADIAWDRDLPLKVNVKNLRRIGQKCSALTVVSDELKRQEPSHCVLCDRAPCLCEIGGEA
jgi:hypothetical protein